MLIEEVGGGGDGDQAGGWQKFFEQGDFGGARDVVQLGREEVEVEIEDEIFGRGAVERRLQTV